MTEQEICFKLSNIQTYFDILKLYREIQDSKIKALRAYSKSKSIYDWDNYTMYRKYLKQIKKAYFI